MSKEFTNISWQDVAERWEKSHDEMEVTLSDVRGRNKDLLAQVEQLEAQIAAAHTLIHQIEDEIKFTGSEINVRKSINNYKAAITDTTAGQSDRR